MGVEISLRVKLNNCIDNVVKLLELTTDCAEEFVCVSSVITSVDVKENIICDVLLDFTFIDDVFVDLGSKGSFGSPLVAKLSFHCSILSSFDSIFLTLFFISSFFFFSFIS